MKRFVATSLVHFIVTSSLIYLVVGLNGTPQWWATLSGGVTGTNMDNGTTADLWNNEKTSSRLDLPVPVVPPVPPPLLETDDFYEEDNRFLSSPFMFAPLGSSSNFKLSMSWLHRVSTTPFHLWYTTDPPGPNSSTIDTWLVNSNYYGTTFLLPKTSVVHGRVVLPLHAAYLWLTSWVLSIWQHGFSALWSMPMPPSSSHTSTDDDQDISSSSSEPVVDLTAGFFLTVAVVTLLGIPLMWQFMEHLAQLLVAARRDRHAASLVQQAWASEKSKQPKEPILPRYTAEETESEVSRLALVGCVVFHIVALIPSLVVEMTTLFPISYATLSLVLVLFCLSRDERFTHPPGQLSLHHFDTEKPPLQKSGKRFFFGRKPARVGSYALVMLSGVLSVCLVLLVPSYVYVVVPLLVWYCTVCYQRAYQSVAVCEEQGNKMVLTGYSSFVDKNELYRAFSLISGPMMLVGILSVALFSFDFSEGTKFRFLDTLQVFVGESQSHKSHFNDPTFSPVSLTGAKEIASDTCLVNLPNVTHCLRSVPNTWVTAEYFGLPLTAAFESFGHRIAYASKQSSRLAYVAFQFISQLSVVVSIVVGLASLLIYRMRHVPDNFESAVQQFRIKYDHVQHCREHWENTAKKNAGPQPPDRFEARRKENVEATKKAAGKKQSGGFTTAPANTIDPQKERASVSLISREEYVLKQHVLLLQWLILSSLAAIMLTVKPDVLLLVVFLPILGLSLSLHAMMIALRTTRLPSLQQKARAPTSESIAAARTSAFGTSLDATMEALEAAIHDKPSPSSQWYSSIRLHDLTDGVWYTSTLFGLYVCFGPLLTRNMLDLSHALMACVAFIALLWWIAEWMYHRCWSRTSWAALLVFIPIQLIVMWLTYQVVASAVQYTKGVKSANTESVLNDIYTLVLSNVTVVIQTCLEQINAVWRPSLWIRNAEVYFPGYVHAAHAMQNVLIAVVIFAVALLHYTCRLFTMGIESEEINLVLP